MTGIVHLGSGAFHRAHRAVFTEDAVAAAGDPRWGVLGVSRRSPRDEALVVAEPFSQWVIEDDVVPTLRPAPDLDLPRYRDTVLERFANPALVHTTAQVVADGSQKLPIRLFGTIADRLAAGTVPRFATRAVAAWIVFVARAPQWEDPLSDVLVATATGSQATLVDRMLALDDVLPTQLREDDAFRRALRAEVADLSRTSHDRTRPPTVSRAATTR